MYKNTKLKVGDRVVANHNSEYEGLNGVILAIKDTDKTTSNVGVDYHVRFDEPSDDINIKVDVLAGGIDEVILDNTMLEKIK